MAIDRCKWRLAIMVFVLAIWMPVKVSLDNSFSIVRMLPALGKGSSLLRQLWSLRLYYFATFIVSTFRADFVGQHRALAVRTSSGIYEFSIVLLSRTVTTMAGMSLLWESHKNSFS